jgi:hypothetical protein
MRGSAHPSRAPGRVASRGTTSAPAAASSSAAAATEGDGRTSARTDTPRRSSSRTTKPPYIVLAQFRLELTKLSCPCLVNLLTNAHLPVPVPPGPRLFQRQGVWLRFSD